MAVDPVAVAKHVVERAEASRSAALTYSDTLALARVVTAAKALIEDAGPHRGEDEPGDPWNRPHDDVMDALAAALRWEP